MGRKSVFYERKCEAIAGWTRGDGAIPAETRCARQRDRRQPLFKHTAIVKLHLTLIVAGVTGLFVLSLLDGEVKLHLFEQGEPRNAAKSHTGFLPVRGHLTCPVTDFANRSTTGDDPFGPLRSNSWLELKEASCAGQTPAKLILAPMPLALREHSILLIVRLGHRDGTAGCVQRNSNIHSMQRLRGKRTAAPDSSNHLLA